MTETTKKSFFSRLGKFFKETKSELKKVTWPDKKTVKKNTGVILVFIIIVALFLFVCDSAFSALSRLFIDII